MKMASLRTGARDGALALVSRDLKSVAPAGHIVPTLQAALDAWERHAPALEDLYRRLNAGAVREVLPFDPAALEAPLPRAYQFLDGSAYLSHVDLVRRARGAEMPPSFRADPLMYQAVSDGFLGPGDDIVIADEAWGWDFEGELAVILGDTPIATGAAAAGRYIRLLMLVNDISLRALIPAEVAKGFGFVVSKPRSACSPVAATPDELAPAWDGRKLHLPLRVHLNGRLVGHPDAGVDMDFDFPRLIEHAARTRPLAAGTIIGSGTVSNRDRASGACCLAELRAQEMLAEGAARTPYLKPGDRVRIEMPGPDGVSIFGAIDQAVVRRGPA